MPARAARRGGGASHSAGRVLRPVLVDVILILLTVLDCAGHPEGATEPAHTEQQSPNARAARTTQDPRLRGHVRSACGSRRQRHHSPHWRHAPSGTFAGPAALSLHDRRPRARAGTLRPLRPPSPSHAPPTCRCHAQPACARTRHHGATRAAHATSCTVHPAHTSASARTWRVGVALVVVCPPALPLRLFQTRLSPCPVKRQNPKFI